MTRGIGGANRPPQKPAKLLSDARKAGSSAKAEAEAKTAPKTLPAPGKGKEPVQVTPEELAAVAKKEKKWEEKRLAEAIKESEKTHEKEQANRAAGLGTSGVAHEKPTPPPTPKALSRSNSGLSSTSSFGTANSDLYSTNGSSTTYHTAGSRFSTSSHGSEPSTPGSSRLSRSVSEVSKKSGSTRPVVDNGPVGNTHAGQDGRVTLEDSPSSKSLTSADRELPDTQHAQPRPPDRKLPLGKFTTKQRIGMGIASGIGLAGLIIGKVVGSDGDSSNDIEY